MLGAHPLLLAVPRGGAALVLLAEGVLSPAVAYQRASAAASFGAGGALVEAAPDTPRFLPPAQALLIERAGQNLCANPRFEGGTPGVIGAGGVWPPDMDSNAPGGITRQIVGFGSEDNIPFVDIRWSGTPTASTTAILTFAAAGGWVCSQGQVFALSLCVRLVSGSLANITNTRLRAQERQGSSVLANIVKPVFTPDASPLRAQRRSDTHTIGQANADNARLNFVFSLTAGQPVDATFRFGLPQVEAGAATTTPILPPAGSPAVSTRAAGGLLYAPAAGLPAAATLLLDAVLPLPLAAERHLLAAETADGTAGLALAATAGPGQLRALPLPGGSPLAGGAIATGQRFRAALAWDAAGIALSLNGTAAVSSAGAPPPLARLRHGGATAPEAIEIRRLELHPARLPDAALAALSTLP